MINKYDVFNWNNFLKKYSREFLERMEDEDFTSLPPEMIEAVWLGYPGVKDEEISAAENRLGLTLPPSYKNFLTITNGWWMFDDVFGRLYPVQEVEILATKNQQFVDDWNKGWKMGWGESISISDEEYFNYEEYADSYRNEYLPTTLVIGGEEGKGLILLNPQIVSDDGEWEAWEFATWYPGAVRYPSFLEIMIDGYKRILDSDLSRIRDIPLKN